VVIKHIFIIVTIVKRCVHDIEICRSSRYALQSFDPATWYVCIHVNIFTGAIIGPYSLSMLLLQYGIDFSSSAIRHMVFMILPCAFVRGFLVKISQSVMTTKFPIMLRSRDSFPRIIGHRIRLCVTREKKKLDVCCVIRTTAIRRTRKHSDIIKLMIRRIVGVCVLTSRTLLFVMLMWLTFFRVSYRFARLIFSRF
jgi:hypothetical protein